MKRTKLFSILMLMTVLALSVMSFIDPTPDFYCYKYVGERPATATSVQNPANYVKLTINTLLTCPTPREVWCGFCIEIGSRYFDSEAGEPNWSSTPFKNLLSGNYTSTSLHGTELSDGSGPAGVFPYFEEDVF